MKASIIEEGSTVGCGYCYDTNEFIFAYDNEVKELTTTIMAGSLYYPCVGFNQNGCKIETNFGKNMFKYQNVIQKYNILNNLRPFDCECEYNDSDENSDIIKESIETAKIPKAPSISSPSSSSFSPSPTSSHKHQTHEKKNKSKGNNKGKSKSKSEMKESIRLLKESDTNESDVNINNNDELCNEKVDKFYSKYYPLTDYICNEYITWSHQTITKFKELSFDEIDILKEIETLVLNTKSAIKDQKEYDTIILENRLIDLDIIIKNFSSFYVLNDRIELLSYLLFVRKALRFVIIHFQFYTYNPTMDIVHCPVINCSETVCDPKYTENKLYDVCMLSQIPFTNYDLISTNIIHKILYIANHIEDIYTNISLSLIIKTVSSLLYYEENNLKYLYHDSEGLYDFIIKHLNELFYNKTEKEHENEEELIQYTLYIISRIIVVNPKIDSKKDITHIANILYDKIEKLDINSLEYFSFILCYTFPEYSFEDNNIDDIYMKWFVYYLKTDHVYYLYLILSCLAKYAANVDNCRMLMEHPLFDDLLEQFKITDDNENGVKRIGQSFDKTLSYYYGLCVCRIIPYIPSDKKNDDKIFKISCSFFQSREKLFSIMHQFGVIIVESILSRDFFSFFMNYKEKYLVLAEIINLLKCKIVEIKHKATKIIHFLIKQEIESNAIHGDFINDIEYLYNVLEPFCQGNADDVDDSLKLLCDWMILMKIADHSFTTIPVNQAELLIERFVSFSVENQLICLKFLNAYFYTQKIDIKFPYSMTCQCPIDLKLKFINKIYTMLKYRQELSEVNYDDLGIIYEFLFYLSYVGSYQAFLMTVEFVELYRYYTNILSDSEDKIINYIDKILNKCLVLDEDYEYKPKDYSIYSFIYFMQHSFKLQHAIVEVILKSIRVFNGKIKDLSGNYYDKKMKNLTSDLFTPCTDFSSEDIMKILYPNVGELKITNRELLFPIACMSTLAYKPMNVDNANSSSNNNCNSFLQSVYPTIPPYIHDLLKCLPSHIYREVFCIYSEDYNLSYEPFTFTLKNEYLDHLSEEDYIFIFKALRNSVPNSNGLDKNKPKPFFCINFKAANYQYTFNSRIFGYINKCFPSSTVFNISIDNSFDNYNQVINDMMTSSFFSICIRENIGNFLKEFEKYVSSVGFQLPKLKALEFRSSKLSFKDIAPFLNIGSRFLSLVSLNFSDIENLGCDGASLIINSISSLQSLKHLSLSNDGLIDDENSSKFIDSIKMSNINFESLNISYNRLSDSFMSDFFNAISNKRSLTSLNISSTELTFEISFNNFSQFLANCTNLKLIDISNNKLKENIEHQLNLVLSLHPQLYHFFAMNNKSINEKNITYWQQLTKYSNENQSSRGGSASINSVNSTSLSSSSSILASLLSPTSPSTPIQETTLYQVALLYSRPLVSMRVKKPEVFTCPEYDVLVSDICKNLSIKKEINVFVGNATLDNVNDLIQMNCEVLHIFARSINDSPNSNSSYFLFETSKNPALAFRYDINALKKLIRTCGKLSLLIITSERIDDIKEELFSDNNNSIESILLVEYSKSNSEIISNFFVELYQSMMNSLQLKEILEKTSIKYYLYPDTNTSKYFTNKRSLKDSRYISFLNPIRENYKYNVLIYRCLFFCDKFRVTTVEYNVSEANEKVANSIIDTAISFLELRNVFEVVNKYDDVDLFEMPEDNSENFKQKKLIVLNGVTVGHNDEKIYKMCYKISDNTLNTNIIVVSKGYRQYPINRIEGIVRIPDSV